MQEANKKPPYLWAIFNNKCPRCREGDIFKTKSAYNLKHITEMHTKCPVCNQPTEIEVGFYYGTSYISYALTVAISTATFIAWWVILGFSLKDDSIFYWLGFNAVFLIVLQPVLMRISRTLWLSWFVKYDPNWRQKKVEEYERINRDQMNNW